MLCEVSSIFSDSLFAIWLVMTVTMVGLIAVSSGPVFVYYYWPSNVTYDKWRYKVNYHFIGI